MEIELLHTLIAQFKTEFIFKSEINSAYTINGNDFSLYKIKKNSIVLKIYDEDEKEFALKIFLESNTKITKHFNIIQTKLPLNSTLLSPITFYADELSIPKLGAAYANLHILIMPWVNGQSLKNKLENLCFVNNIDGIKSLLENFKKISYQKTNDGIIHGDLSIQNIIVDRSGKLTMVDYDTLYVKELDNTLHYTQLSNYYTLPKRKSIVYNIHSDDFSTLILYTTIYALSLRPEFLFKYKKEQSFLFSKETIYQWETSQLKNDLSEIKDSHLNDLILIISTALKQNTIGIENLNEIIFNTNSENIELKKHKLQTNYLKACLEDNEYLLTGLNNEIARQTILADKIKYEKKILEEEVKLFKIQNLQRKSTSSLIKITSVAASILLLGTTSIFTYNYLKKDFTKKENDTIINTNTINKNQSKESATKIPEVNAVNSNEAVSSTKNKDLTLLNPKIELNSTINKELNKTSIADKNNILVNRESEKSTLINNITSKKMPLNKKNNMVKINITSKPIIKKKIITKSVTFKPID